MSSNRRQFIKIVVAGAVAAGCPVDLSLLASAAEAAPRVDSEHNTICHQVRDGIQFEPPPPSQRYEVVVVGGGMSGLAAAYLLQHRDFLLLEKEPHWGGNAYEMAYNGALYATGAAFVESAPAADLAREIGLTPLPINNWDPSIIKGEFIEDTWGAGLDHLPYPEAVREGFKKFKKAMLAIDREQRRLELDNTPFSQLLQGYPAELTQWFNAYAPSNWGSMPASTSAYVALGDIHWFAGENRKDDRTTWPGGMGALSAKLAEVLAAKHRERMLTDCTAVLVAAQGKEVNVTFFQGQQLKTVAAKGVIMATPKLITSRIVPGLPEEQRQAMRRVRYAPYPVVNLIFDRPVYNRGYDTWCPGNSFTDFIVADWVIRNQPGYRQKYNILTFYTPMREDQRQQLLTESGARRVAQRVMRDFRKLFPGSDVDPLEAHIYRRGHPMFMATPGNFTHVLPLGARPRARIFFANTDSAGPVSTSSGAIVAARRAAGELERALTGARRRRSARAGASA